MSEEKIESKEMPSTEPYKGVRDFYPEDMAVQRYIFDTWAKVAESFGFERYDASILEPSQLYKAKGSENEEMVNEQTYTFIDRGDREVTLRPEMTPTVARMVAGRRRELAFPLRWYSIPNLFRYERAQRGRLREHWQLNADIFGSHDQNADVEIILLATEVLKAFGATERDFEVKINARKIIPELIRYFLRQESTDATDLEIHHYTRLLDRRNKISSEQFHVGIIEIFGPDRGNLLFKQKDKEDVQRILPHLPSYNAVVDLMVKLKKLGVNNIQHDSDLARGFDYYTGTIFEIFDTNPENRRSLLGGGRYDNLTGLFDGDPIPAVGFGMGDVTMRDFLETHDLLKHMPEAYRPGPQVFVLTKNASQITDAEKVAAKLRVYGIRTAVNLVDKSIGEQNKLAELKGAKYTIEIGDPDSYTLKTLKDRSTQTGTFENIINAINR